MNKRLKYALTTIILLAIETTIALSIHAPIIRSYIGDVLAVIVLYTCIRIFTPEKHPILPLYIFLFATLIETAQYFHIVNLLGLSKIRFFYILIGGTFDWKDIVCYAIGCSFLFACEWLIRRNKNQST